MFASRRTLWRCIQKQNFIKLDELDTGGYRRAWSTEGIDALIASYSGRYFKSVDYELNSPTSLKQSESTRAPKSF